MPILQNEVPHGNKMVRYKEESKKSKPVVKYCALGGMRKRGLMRLYHTPQTSWMKQRNAEMIRAMRGDVVKIPPVS
jgi:hypothetical protein